MNTRKLLKNVTLTSQRYSYCAECMLKRCWCLLAHFLPSLHKLLDWKFSSTSPMAVLLIAEKWTIDCVRVTSACHIFKRTGMPKGKFWFPTSLLLSCTFNSLLFHTWEACFLLCGCPSTSPIYRFPNKPWKCPACWRFQVEVKSECPEQFPCSHLCFFWVAAITVESVNHQMSNKNRIENGWWWMMMESLSNLHFVTTKKPSKPLQGCKIVDYSAKCLAFHLFKRGLPNKCVFVGFVESTGPPI